MLMMKQMGLSVSAISEMTAYGRKQASPEPVGPILRLRDDAPLGVLSTPACHIPAGEAIDESFGSSRGSNPDSKPPISSRCFQRHGGRHKTAWTAVTGTHAPACLSACPTSLLNRLVAAFCGLLHGFDPLLSG